METYLFRKLLLSNGLFYSRLFRRRFVDTVHMPQYIKIYRIEAGSLYAAIYTEVR
jgi:hypothetical protein